MRAAIAAIIGLATLAGSAFAQGKTFVLAIEPELEASGLIAYVVPRFALKYSIRPTILSGDVEALASEADVVIAETEQVAELLEAALIVRRRGVFYTEAEPARRYAIALIEATKNAPAAEKFMAWITGEIGQRTIATYAPDGEQIFLPGSLNVAAPAAPEPTGDAVEGERLSLFHCGRCHVVNEKNRMGGIGSTPSFAALRGINGWQDKFLAFWSHNPHPSFTQVQGLTEPFDPDHPPHIAPVEITQEDIEAIFAYAATIEPKDLGAPINER